MMIPTQYDWIYQLYVKEFGNKLLPTDFYYDSNGNMVMTEKYHKRRGSCCGKGCLHCPYDPPHERGNTTLQKIKSD